jgi:iron-sulfur cluster repair protein YtfE (RIC family)
MAARQKGVTMGEPLAVALEREHHEIDEGVAAFEQAPAQRHDQLARAAQALRRHIYLEESQLFPALQTGGLVAPVFVMLREHGEMWRTLDALLVEARADPSGAGTKQLLHELTVQLQHHNMKEERILYPQADDALDEQQAAALRDFLVDGTMPDGWVCARA